MARVSIYLNFANKTEEAFNFYKKVFGTDFEGDGIMYFKDVPNDPKNPIPEEAKNLVMHVSLPILGGFVLMGTDAPESMGMSVKYGNNVYINLEPDTKEISDKLYAALSEGGTKDMPLQDMFWGGYYGSCTDKYGVKWMFNCQNA